MSIGVDDILSDLLSEIEIHKVANKVLGSGKLGGRAGRKSRWCPACGWCPKRGAEKTEGMNEYDLFY